MKNRKYIIDGDSIYTMTQVIHDNLPLSKKRHRHILRLFYSKQDPSWNRHVAGTLAAKLECDGNGFDITFRGGKKLRLDYSEAAELQFLLDEEGRVNYKTLGKLKGGL